MQPKPGIPSSLLTKADAARELRVCVRTLENWLKARRLSFIKAGRCVRIERIELERFKQSLTIQAID